MADESSETATPPRPKASVWPMLIAFGLAISEVGVLFAVLPLSVFGILLFAGGIAGIVTETGYVDQPWPTLAGLAFVSVVVGGGLFVGNGGGIMQNGDVIAVPNGVAYRGVSIAVAGVLGLLLALYGRLRLEIQPAHAR
ncbi:DUF7541 family protein [Haloarchaeobius salinus]|uniref:DUF7541 family protein n=1 Tax=Haloarchaeobius salinus TaxID=1198298 RepID=UPI00210AE21E|nr:cox cluster protein [Haloarchaeobius salinus]